MISIFNVSLPFFQPIMEVVPPLEQTLITHFVDNIQEFLESSFGEKFV